MLMAEAHGSWKDPTFIAELVTATGLSLWVVVTVLTSLNPYVAIGVALSLYILVLLSLFYRKRTEDRLSLAQINAQSELAKAKIFYDTALPHASQTERELIEATGRNMAYLGLIAVFEQSARDQTLTEEKRAVYAEVVKRLKDIQLASTFS